MSNTVIYIGRKSHCIRCAVSNFKSEEINGKILFCQEELTSQITLTGKLQFTKVRDSKHGFHVHEFGDLSNGCISAGAHYNPYNMSHGSLTSEIRHVGDFGNIYVDSKGTSDICMTLPKNVTLFGDTSIIGRTLMIHDKEDDLGQGGDEESKKTGNAGARIGCSVIGISNTTECCQKKT
ncbi:hypothetical protein HZS_6632 [Henneguya salminicola]|nr:hypothetical protein HZS_6632 [Henneguya salminicola]